MSKYTPLRREAEKEIEEARVGKIKEHLKVLLSRKEKLEKGLEEVEEELKRAEEAGEIKAIGVKGGPCTYAVISAGTMTGTTGLQIDMN